MTRLLLTLSTVCGVAITGLTALPMSADVRAYVVFTLGLVVAGVGAWLQKPPEG